MILNKCSIEGTANPVHSFLVLAYRINKWFVKLCFIIVRILYMGLFLLLGLRNSERVVAGNDCEQ